MTSFPDTISLASGYGNFTTPPAALQQATTLLQGGPLPLSPIEGLPALRAALAARYQRQGAAVAPEQIVVTPGAKPALLAVLKALLSPGHDEVLLLTPNWFGFQGLVEKAGGTLRTLPLDPATDYALDVAAVQAALTPRTRVLLLSNPNNPTGRVYHRAELAALLHLTRQHPQLMVLADEIYDGICFGPDRVPSLLEFDDPLSQHVVVSGFSKSLALIGWSVGYLVAPAAVARQCAAWQFATAAAVSAVSQAAALAATEQAESISAGLCAGLRANRERMVAALAAMPSVRQQLPQGTYYVFPDFRAFLNPALPLPAASADLAARLRAGGVEVVDGASCDAPGFFRISYAVPEPELREALRRLTAALPLR
ncbi:aminotransferase class I/II-fold pyridoxal phosphate-dependent enzyme [Hymenobacter aquaticus]|uniref:Aminotransferase class I/II-fold pyridoxal phosphate-dependent enzyme n=1 Tax=Hymenobacter aquaticus TaxID=1867101 RepID=A0A4Z0Q1C7_9BACT|nr:aminotransferase class I/II-fold pyridoxal phosphate-dependent enzyme [Hymenobacter aquaticus]TGE23790.1 aminotransferase class I/II-fold pyridoxal phosphate-dependent enzyme [Hymenobacter aquaticus]